MPVRRDPELSGFAQCSVTIHAGDRMNTIAAALFTFAGSILAFAGPPPAASPRMADEVYYRCPSGYAFETSGSAVRCRKPAWVEQHALAGCPIGLYPTVDRVGSKDMCAATNGITGEIDVEQGCTSADVVQGFTKKIVIGKDYCAKGHPAEVVAPSIAITL